MSLAAEGKADDFHPPQMRPAKSGQPGVLDQPKAESDHFEA
jgi:hypothetical protein